PESWAGNILFPRGQAMAGIAPRKGVRIVDPRLERAADGLWRPAAGSPLLGAGAPRPFEILQDMDGQPRKGAADIGADQRSSAPVLRRPLKAAAVGPVWMRPTGR